MGGHDSMMLRIPMWDPATPSFVSAASYAYGTPADVDGMVRARESALAGFPGNDGDDPIVQTWHGWKAGLCGTTVSIAYSEQAFAVPVKVVGMHEEHFDRFACRHENIWGFPYEVDLTDVVATLAWLVDDAETAPLLLRTVRIRAGEMSMNGRPVTMAMGEPGIISFGGDDGFAVESTMYLVDKSFSDIGEMRADIASPAEIDLRSFVDQVVADG